MRKRYTYIPKEEIAEVVTFNDVSFSSDDLLDGAYVKGRKKFARGGKTSSKRVMSLEEQAAESVGYDVWYQLEAFEQKELVDELLESGIIVPMFALGGNVVSLEKFKVGDKVKYKNAKYHATVISVVEDEIPYAVIEYSDGKVVNAYLEDLTKVELGVAEEYVNPKYAAPSGVPSGVMVKYVMKDKPDEVKESTFDDEEDAQMFYDIMAEDEEVLKVYPVEKIAPPAPAKTAEKPKKSLFETAKVVPATAASKKKRERVEVAGIADQIARYDQLKATINNAKAEQEVIGGILKEIGREKFLDLYEQRGSRPANFDLADGNENILLEVTDKYLKVEPEKAEILRQYDGLLEEKTTYEFNPELLEKEVAEGMTIGDVISMLIQDSKLIPDEDKGNLITAKQSIRVPKGTLDRLMQYDNPRQVFSLISPILALK